MPHPGFRLITDQHMPDHDDAVIFVTRLRRKISACVLMPPRTGEMRVSNFYSLEEAVDLASSAADRYNLSIAVLLDEEERVHWRREWRSLFGRVQ